jgi:hypothetical protein
MKETGKERSDRVRETFTWAQNRAGSSAAPGKFMVAFEDGMEALFKGREGEVLDSRPSWQDPTRLAAEIEALGAYRALTHWGTSWGRYDPKSKHYFRKHGQGA